MKRNEEILARFCRRLVALDMDIFGLRKATKIAQDEDTWITVHPGGKGPKADGSGNKGGTPVLIDGETGEIKAGMGGKFNGKRMNDIKKKPASVTPSASKKSATIKNMLSALTPTIAGNYTIKDSKIFNSNGDVIHYEDVMDEIMTNALRLTPTESMFYNNLEYTLQHGEDETEKEKARAAKAVFEEIVNQKDKILNEYIPKNIKIDDFDSVFEGLEYTLSGDLKEKRLFTAAKRKMVDNAIDTLIADGVHESELKSLEDKIYAIKDSKSAVDILDAFNDLKKSGMIIPDGMTKEDWNKRTIYDAYERRYSENKERLKEYTDQMIKNIPKVSQTEVEKMTDREFYSKLNDGWNNYPLPEILNTDSKTQYLCQMLDLNEKPTLVSKNEFKKLVDDPSSLVIYRGVDSEHINGADIIHDLKHGDYTYYGNGIYGDGLYFSNYYGTAEGYSDSRYSIATCVIDKKKAKILETNWNGDYNTEYALRNGYNVLEVKQNNYNDESYFVVLDRSVLITEE